MGAYREKAGRRRETNERLVEREMRDGEGEEKAKEQHQQKEKILIPGI